MAIFQRVTYTETQAWVKGLKGHLHKNHNIKSWDPLFKGTIIFICSNLTLATQSLSPTYYD